MSSTKSENLSGGFKNKGTFQIAISAETFRILSAGLYSDPHLAIVREYSTNALDSHVAAGNMEPFDVHLPTAENPLFMIRDYGTGMPRKQVETVCQTYGASTKRDTNVSTGKFGLGFKSALAYVNTFSVMSYLDGTVSKYMIQMDDEGMPQLLYDDDMPTEEPNGVKIQFYVNPRDASDFRRAARQVYPFFSIKPNFLGDEVPEIEEPEYVMSGVEQEFSWRVFAPEDNFKKSLIIMGSNAYPVPDNNNYDGDSVHYFVDMDLFEPTPSRETLQWTRTDLEKFAEMRAQVVGRIEATFKKETEGMTAWEEVSHHFACPAPFVQRCLQAYITSKYPNQVKKHGTYFRVQFDTRSWHYGGTLSICGLDKLVPLGKIDVPDRQRWTDGAACKFLRPKDFDRIDHKMAAVSADAPVRLLVYDAKGINDAVPGLEARTLVIGSPAESQSVRDAAVKELTTLLDGQKIPYKLQYLSDVLAALPPRPKVTRMATASPAGLVGVFRPYGNVFQRLDSLDGYTHYLPFDDEDTFNLKSSLPAAYHSDMSGSAAGRIKFNRLAAVFGMPDAENVKVCFIRPRFVERYAEVLLPWAADSDACMRERFRNDWMAFTAVMSTRLIYDQLTYEASELRDWIFEAIDPWWHLNVTYPLTRRLLETNLKHRYNKDRLVLASHGRYGFKNGLERSQAATKACDDVAAACRWIYELEDFRTIFQGWFEAFEAEVTSMLRTHPYLFRSVDDILRDSLVAGRLRNS